MYSFTYTTRAEAAHFYRSQNWWPIPLDGKCPITKWTTDPPLSDEQIDLLWPNTPTARQLNVGIRMGACSGLIALDIDGQKGRDFITSRLTPREITQLTQTMQFQTPNGLRLLYDYPKEPTPSRSFRDPDRPGAELVRVLSDGTQTVAPPSSHINGTPYIWTAKYYTAIWPAHLVATFESPSPIPQIIDCGPRHLVANSDRVRRATAWLRKCDPAISGQGGHNQTYKIAVRLCRGFELSYHEALALLTDIYNPTCQPPWSDAELEHKIESALKSTSPTRNML